MQPALMHNEAMLQGMLIGLWQYAMASLKSLANHGSRLKPRFPLPSMSTRASVSCVEI
jgi:hypothetical protein